MSQIKCKMCGGDLQIVAGSSVAECEYCGTRQTLPKLNDERKANLYDRASHFRRLNDYDKAQSIYEQILAEDKTDAELYWSLVLCRYGIEYVEDPRSHKRIPTINRTQYNSILSDADYLSALQYADSEQRAVYEEEAQSIDKIQKGILSISKSEKPYDIFICYKETDDHGRRTIDSVLAQDLYKELTNEGFKVFFSRITLENQLGTAYEPYIFAALNSAKVMVVVGTKPEHFNAVWVKNEWSRYLSLMRNGEHKTLIPAYRDMNPYDLPEEFSYLQGQDMSKIGFMQDLLRGIKKVVNGGIPEEKAQKSYSQNPNQENSAVAPLLRRAEIFWEEGNAARATEYLNRVLDMDPENGRAYLQLLLIDFNAKSLDDLFEHNESIESNINYQRIMRYAGDEVKDELYSSRKKIISKRNDAIYNEAMKKMQSGDVALIEKALKEFKAIPSWRDANQLAEKCAELIISIPKDRVYTTALKMMEKKDISSLEKAIEEFSSISDWKDSAEKVKECRRSIQQIKNDQTYEEASKLMEGSDILNLKKASVLFASLPGWKESDQLAEYCNSLVKSIPLDKTYLKARSLMQKGDISSLEQAAKEFDSIADWKDSAEKANECRKTIMKIKNDTAYDEAVRLMQGQDVSALKQATKLLDSISGWKDSAKKAEQCRKLIHEIESDTTYNQAVQLMQSQDVPDLKKSAALLSSISGWRDADQLAERCEKLIISIPNDRLYEQALTLMQSNEINKLKQAVQSFESISTWKDSSEKIEECQQMIQTLQKNQTYDAAVKLMSKGKKRDLQKAMTAFSELKNWKDSEDLLCQCQEKLDEQQTKGTANADKRKTSFLRVLKVSVVAAALLMIAALTPKVIEYTEPKIAEYRYNKALTLIEEGQYEKSFPILEKLGDYSDAKEQLTEAKYALAVEYQNSGDYDSAVAILTEIDGSIKTSDFDEELQYLVGKAELGNGNYEEAIAQFLTITRYKDSRDWLNESRYQLAQQYVAEEKFEEAIDMFEMVPAYKNSQHQMYKAGYLLGKQYLDEGNYEQAVLKLDFYKDYGDAGEVIKEARYLWGKDLMAKEDYIYANYQFDMIRPYKDSSDLACESNYLLGKRYMDEENWSKAVPLYTKSKDYKDSKELLKQCYYQQGLSYLDEQKYTLAINRFEAAGDYTDAPEKLAEAQKLLEEQKTEAARKAAEQKAAQEAAALQRAKNGYELTYSISSMNVEATTGAGYKVHSLSAKLIDDNKYEVTLTCTLPQKSRLALIVANHSSHQQSPYERFEIVAKEGKGSYTWTVDRDKFKNSYNVQFVVEAPAFGGGTGSWIHINQTSIY